MDERPEPPPWGLLISQALKRSGLSARKAASRADLSEGRWRQITSGYQNVSAGVYAPVRGPADTLARMAQVVGVTPEQLENADRPDAAEELRTLAGPAPPDIDDDTYKRIDSTLTQLEATVHEAVEGIAELQRDVQKLREEQRPPKAG